MWSMREPAGRAGEAGGGGGSAGGWSGAAGAGGGAAEGRSGAGISGVVEIGVREADGGAAVDAGGGAPVPSSIWSVPTHRDGPYPSHSSSEPSSSEIGQHSQSMASMRWSVEMFMSSQ